MHIEAAVFFLAQPEGHRAVQSPIVHAEIHLLLGGPETAPVGDVQSGPDAGQRLAVHANIGLAFQLAVGQGDQHIGGLQPGQVGQLHIGGDAGTAILIVGREFPPAHTGQGDSDSATEADVGGFVQAAADAAGLHWQAFGEIVGR